MDLRLSRRCHRPSAPGATSLVRGRQARGLLVEPVQAPDHRLARELFAARAGGPRHLARRALGVAEGVPSARASAAASPSGAIAPVTPASPARPPRRRRSRRRQPPAAIASITPAGSPRSRSPAARTGLGEQLGHVVAGAEELHAPPSPSSAASASASVRSEPSPTMCSSASGTAPVLGEGPDHEVEPLRRREPPDEQHPAGHRPARPRSARAAIPLGITRYCPGSPTRAARPASRSSAESATIAWHQCAAKPLQAHVQPGLHSLRRPQRPAVRREHQCAAAHASPPRRAGRGSPPSTSGRGRRRPGARAGRARRASAGRPATPRGGARCGAGDAAALEPRPGQ